MTFAYLGPEDVLTVGNVQELPNGMATIVPVQTNDRKDQADARIDDYGRLRALDPGHAGQFFQRGKWEVVSR
ncbi:hypothetical protein [Halorubrum sp. GN11GM_10-3_MGM]|uniref:hypothetical protein n=1 Tax=Halorubrum sp. GN11GM_10-3_MGM TaxID=2518111 RepID=UPI0010F540F1|nr:hypothetical protein [Halorubrum sp. GN11GM_10-3_MGM]TKX70934.1 hypothetical protein EXE40_08540 [Halorubrum sp. GN11GM_10-3_MGM]